MKQYSDLRKKRQKRWNNMWLTELDYMYEINIKINEGGKNGIYRNGQVVL